MAETDSAGIATYRFKPDISGSYTIRAELAEGGSRATVRVQAAFFESVKNIKLTLKAEDGTILPSVRFKESGKDGYVAEDGRLEAEISDENGTKAVANGKPSYGLKFTSSRPDLVVVESDGDILVKDPNFRGYVPITVANEKNTVSAVYNLLVAGPPVNIQPTVEATGKKALVILQYVDNAGKPTHGFTANEDYIINLPVGLGKQAQVNFNAAGSASFELYSSDYGAKNISVATLDEKLKKTIRIDFEQETKPGVDYSHKVVMFIGSRSYMINSTPMLMDVGPFIKDGRTFTSVRPIADAFGAEVDWNEAQQLVTLTRDGLIVKIKIGSRAIEVINEGISNIITTDVAAFVQEGRTVLPFRAVGEAFGAEVEYDAQTGAVSYRI